MLAIAEELHRDYIRRSLPKEHRFTIVRGLANRVQRRLDLEFWRQSKQVCAPGAKDTVTLLMTEPTVTEDRVYTFVLDQIDTVPHLEALLLLWNSRPQPWTVENLAKRLYVSAEIVNDLLADLVRRRLIVCVRGTPDGYRYESSSLAQDQLLSTLDSTYRRETVRISTMIHSKPSSSVREFARAFRFRKDRA